MAVIIVKENLGVYLPDDFDSQKSYSLILNLHWYTGSINHYGPFHEFLRDHNYIVAIPQSSQMINESQRTWEDSSIALSEVLGHYEFLSEQYKIDKVILAGSSQGAIIAIKLLFEMQPIEVDAFILLIPAIHSKLLNQVKLIKSILNLPGMILIGENDSFYENTMEFIEFLESRNLKISKYIYPTLGHDYPNNYREDMLEFLEKL